MYEYYGCFSHSHCGDNKDHVRWQKTLDREDKLRNLGYNVVSITSCMWQVYHASTNPVSQTPCSLADMISGIMSDESFGFVKCDLHTPEHLIPKFSEFPVIFKNVEIPISAIGEHIQEFCRKTTRR